MTRKDYLLIAEAIQRTHHMINQTATDSEWVEAERHIAVDAAARHLADALATDNDEFDRERFLFACAVKS